MKTSKKILSLILCVGMLASMFVAVGVSAEDTGVEIFRHDFGNGTDYSTLSATELKTNTKYNFDFVTDDAKADKGSYVKITPQEDAITGTDEPLYVRDIPLNVGSKYKVTIRAKADGKPKHMSRFMLQYTGTQCYLVSVEAPTSKQGTIGPSGIIGNDWVDYELAFTAKDFVKDATGTKLDTNSIKTQFRFGITSLGLDEAIYLDYISIKEYKGPQITVNITGDGSVSYSDVAVTSGETINGMYGGETVLDIVSNDPGKSARVTVNGKKQAVNNNQITVKEDAVVNVSFEAPAIVYENYFEDAETDKTRGIIAQGNVPLDIVTDEEAGSVLELKIEKDISSTKGRVINIGETVWEKGYTYNVSYKTKASKNNGGGGNVMLGFAIPNITNGAASNYPGAWPGYNVMWQSRSYNFTIDDFIVSTSDTTPVTLEKPLTAAVFFEPSGFNKGDWIRIDDFVITRTVAPKVTVSTTEGGTVVRKFSDTLKQTVTDGKVYYSEKGKTVTFIVTPDQGKRAVVKINGEKVELNNSNEVAFVLNEDSTLEVTFKDENTVEIEKTEVLFVDYDGQPAVYVYSLISEFVPGENLGYGINLWETSVPEKSVKLEAKADNKGTPAVAQSGQAFVIKAFGDAIKADRSYTAKAYVGETEGEAVTVSANK